MKSVRATPAFTLLELLVAVTLALGLAGLLIVVTRNTLELWQKAQDRSAVNIQAKVALDLLVRDLQAAIPGAAGEATLAIDIVESGSLGAHGWRLVESRIKPDIVNLVTEVEAPHGGFLELSRAGRGGVWLRFLTSNVRSGGSDPAMVAYQINRRPAAGGAIAGRTTASIRYTLFRQAVAADDTFAIGYNATAHDAALDQPTVTDALCDNVVDFAVWCYRREANGSLQVLYPLGRSDRSHRGAGVLLPDVVDVMLRVMTESGAARLEQMELGRIDRPRQYASDGDWWWAIVEAESRVVTARVILGAGGVR